jgi:CRP-like cAMP-binding protein
MRSGAMLHSIENPGSNGLLAGLPPEDGGHLASLSRIEHPPHGRILTSPFEPGTGVWFPHTGAIALITTDASGRSVQTGLIGREGCVGLEGLFGERRSAPEAVVQIEGVMSVISAPHLKAAFNARPQVRIALSNFLYTLSAQSLQTIACNRLHSLLSRCCRWLLTFQDKAESDNISITQEDLATLIGSGRPRVNVLLATLEKDGILRRSRGCIHLLTRAGLEWHTCECYNLACDPSELLRNT